MPGSWSGRRLELRQDLQLSGTVRGTGDLRAADVASLFVVAGSASSSGAWASRLSSAAPGAGCDGGPDACVRLTRHNGCGGVYLVGQAFPLFSPVRLVIAYTGAFTLPGGDHRWSDGHQAGAAYSTVSQLRFMMLAAGRRRLGRRTCLLTHAFFKATMFLRVQGVILSCPRAGLTGSTGSMELIPADDARQRVGDCGDTVLQWVIQQGHDLVERDGLQAGKPGLVLFILPLITAGMTAFYMFRLVPGLRQDPAPHPRTVPWVMALPLVGACGAKCLCVAWGWPLWEPDASTWDTCWRGSAWDGPRAEAEPPAAGSPCWRGIWRLAVLMYGTKKIDPAVVRAKAGSLYGVRREKWHFDELYDALFVRPAVALAYETARFDKRAVPVAQADVADRTVNVSSLDGVLNAFGLGTLSVGRSLRGAQTGLIRGYVTVLLLAAVALVGVLVAVYAGG